MVLAVRVLARPATTEHVGLGGAQVHAQCYEGAGELLVRKQVLDNRCSSLGTAWPSIAVPRSPPACKTSSDWERGS
jgi:hypothetical protein